MTVTFKTNTGNTIAFRTLMRGHEDVRCEENGTIYGQISEKGNKGTTTHRFEVYVQSEDGERKCCETFATKKDSRQFVRDVLAK